MASKQDCKPRPVIGVTGRRFLASSFSAIEMAWAMAGVRVDAFYTHYAERLTAAGGMPLFATRECNIAELLDLLDGIVIAGGVDVDPRLHGGELTEHSTQLDPEHDEFEIALVLAAIERGVPVLGTCRGHQILNVALGGTLRSHLDGGSGAHHRRLVYPLADRGHRIRCKEGSLVQDLYGDLAEVNSFHHQAIDRPGAGVRATAEAEDGVIEAIEVKGVDALGVQWHPEFATGVEPALRWLVERAGVASDSARRRA